MRREASRRGVAGALLVMFLVILSAVARAGDEATGPVGRIDKIQNTWTTIQVTGRSRGAALWVGCTFFPDTRYERDMPVKRDGRTWFRTDSTITDWTMAFEVLMPSVDDIVRRAYEGEAAPSEVPYVVALWQRKVVAADCRNGTGGGVCDYCRRNGFHMEGRVDAARGTWAIGDLRERKRPELQEAQRQAEIAEERERVRKDAAAAAELERQALADAERRRAEEEARARAEDERRRAEERATREARLEEERRRAEAERQAREAEAQRRAREEAERQARLEEERRRQEAERQAKEEEARRRAQEEADRKARLEEQRRHEEEARRRQEEEQQAKRDQTARIGAEVRTITPEEMRKRKINEVFNRILVTAVADGSPAARAGLKAGMIIVNINGTMVEDASAFPSTGRRGDTFRLNVIGHRAVLIQMIEGDFK